MTSQISRLSGQETGQPVSRDGADSREPKSVIIPRGSHPFPSRTRKLSPAGPIVLHGKLCGRVGHRRHYKGSVPKKELSLFRFTAASKLRSPEAAKQRGTGRPRPGVRVPFTDDSCRDAATLR